MILLFWVLGAGLGHQQAAHAAAFFKLLHRWIPQVFASSVRQSLRQPYVCMHRVQSF